MFLTLTFFIFVAFAFFEFKSKHPDIMNSMTFAMMAKQNQRDKDKRSSRGPDLPSPPKV